VIFRSVLSTLSDPAVLAVAVMLSVPLTCALFWTRRMRRLAARRAYLRADSRYFVWLRGGFWMLLGQFALALLWTGLLLVGLARQVQPFFWVLLVLFIPIWVHTNDSLEKRFQPHIQEPFRRVLAYRVSRVLCGLCMLAILLVWALFQPVPEVSGVPLETAILTFTQEDSARSRSLQAGIDTLAVMDAVRYWVGENLAGTLPGPALRGLVWSIILVQEWILLWPVLLLLQAVHLLVRGQWIQQIKGSRS